MSVQSVGFRKDYGRKRLLIYPKFQLTLISLNTFILFGVLATVGVQIHRALTELKQMGVDAHLAPTHPYYRFLETQSSTIYSYLVFAFLGSFLVSAMITLVLSHRLAGPIVRLRSYFENISRGKKLVQPLSFRKDDFFRDLPPIINQALVKLEKAHAASNEKPEIKKAS